MEPGHIARRGRIRRTFLRCEPVEDYNNERDLESKDIRRFNLLKHPEELGERQSARESMEK